MPDGLMAHYLFDGDARDTSGNQHHGVVHSAVLTEDRLRHRESAYSFLAFGARIEIAHNTDLTPAYLTIACWVRAHSLSSYKAIVMKSGANWPDGYGIGNLSGTQSMGFFVRRYTPHRAMGALPLGEWAHVVATYDGEWLAYDANGSFAQDCEHRTPI